jgi:hypothetical protein
VLKITGTQPYSAPGQQPLAIACLDPAQERLASLYESTDICITSGGVFPAPSLPIVRNSKTKPARFARGHENFKKYRTLT